MRSILRIHVLRDRAPRREGSSAHPFASPARERCRHDGVLLRCLGNDGGQMTVELAVILPVALAIAVVAVNAVFFFSECASFDRVARNAIRVYATSPDYGQGIAQTESLIQGAVDGSIPAAYEKSTVAAHAREVGMTEYSVTLDYAPNLFGMGLKESVFGVSLPHLSHTTSLVVCTYKPGVFF